MFWNSICSRGRICFLSLCSWQSAISRPVSHVITQVMRGTMHAWGPRFETRSVITHCGTSGDWGGVSVDRHRSCPVGSTSRQQAVPLWKYQPLNERDASSRECLQKLVSCGGVFCSRPHLEWGVCVREYLSLEFSGAASRPAIRHPV